MNGSAWARWLSSGRVMQWLSSRPPARSFEYRNEKYDLSCAAPDVLGEPDGADGVEPGLGDVAVVAVPDLDEVAQATAGDLLLGPERLVARQGHAQGLHAVVLGGVHRHLAPPAADVEQAHARLQRQLVGHQGVLGELRVLERRRLVRVRRAGVGHRRAEDQLVEAVRDVVVVLDRLGVAGLRVHPARLAMLLGRRRQVAVLQPDGGQPHRRRRERRGGHVGDRQLAHRGERGVEVTVDVQVAGHVGPGEPERVRRAGQVGQRGLGADSTVAAGSLPEGFETLPS